MDDIKQAHADEIKCIQQEHADEIERIEQGHTSKMDCIKRAQTTPPECEEHLHELRELRGLAAFQKGQCQKLDDALRQAVKMIKEHRQELDGCADYITELKAIIEGWEEATRH